MLTTTLLLAVLTASPGVTPKSAAKVPAQTGPKIAVAMRFRAASGAEALGKLAASKGAVVDLTEIVLDAYKVQLVPQLGRMGAVAKAAPRETPEALVAAWNEMTEVCLTRSGREPRTAALNHERTELCTRERGDAYVRRLLQARGIETLYELRRQEQQQGVDLILTKFDTLNATLCEARIRVGIADRDGMRVLGALFANVEANKCTSTPLDLNAPGPTAPASIARELGIGRTDYAPVKVVACAEAPAALTFDEDAPFFQKTLATRWQQSVKDVATAATQQCNVRTMKLTLRGPLSNRDEETVIIDLVCGARFARLEFLPGFPVSGDTSEKASKRLVESLAKAFCGPAPAEDAAPSSIDL